MENFKIKIRIGLTIFLFFGLLIPNNTMGESSYSSNLEWMKKRVEWQQKSLAEAKKELENIESGETYIEKIDDVMLKLKEEEKMMKKVLERASSSRNKLTQNKSSQKVRIILDYLIQSILVEQKNLNLQNFIEKEELSNKKLEEINNSYISQKDKKQAEDRLAEIQLNLFEEIKLYLEKYLWEIQNGSSYQAKWDMNLVFNINHESIWEIKTDTSINNYISNISWLNSSFSWDFKTSLESKSNYFEDIDLSIETFMETISLDNYVYLLLDDLKIEDNSSWKIFQKSIEDLKKIAEEKQYIKYNLENQDLLQQTEALNLEWIDFWKLLSDMQESLKEPLFEAYEKKDNRYLLIPSKYACDKLKELKKLSSSWAAFLYKFSSSCSESDYKNLVKKVSDSWVLYMEIKWNETILGFDFYPQNWMKSWDSYILFDKWSIEKIYSEAILENKEENLKLDYVANEKLDFKMKSGLKIQIILESKLDKNNRFSYLDFYFNMKWIGNISLNISNKNLVWDFDYDYGDLNISGEMTGKQNSSNEIQDFNLVLSWIDIKSDSEALNMEFDKQKDDYYLVLDILDDWEEHIYMDLSLENKNISGETKVFDKTWEAYIQIEHSWSYDDTYLEFKNKAFLEKDLLSLYLGSEKDDNKDIVSIFDIVISFDSGESIFDMKFEYDKWDRKVFEMILENDANIEYKDIEIKAPKNSINLQDVLE